MEEGTLSCPTLSCWKKKTHVNTHLLCRLCSSRTKNMMWYGVLGTKELLQRTYKNLEQRVQLEVLNGAGPTPLPP